MALKWKSGVFSRNALPFAAIPCPVLEVKSFASQSEAEGRALQQRAEHTPSCLSASLSLSATSGIFSAAVPTALLYGQGIAFQGRALQDRAGHWGISWHGGSGHLNTPPHATQVAPENVPEDPWMVLEPNHLYLSDDDIQLREKMLDAVYPEWDLDGSGRVELNEIKQICVSFVGCNIESTHLDMLNRLGTLVTAQRIPEEGYARDILIPFVIRLTNSFSEVPLLP